jgi:dTDP-4-dehydrorhamnose reductase
VTGASGFLGRVLVQRAVPAWEVVGTFLSQPPPGSCRAVRLDVTDAAAVDALVAAERPDAVIHTAYRQHGDDAHAVNADGAGHVAAAARAAGARLVHVSTDVVFAGDGDRALREEDPVGPVTAYGATKAAAERLVAAAHPGALIVRTSLIYGGPGRAASPFERLAVEAAQGRRAATFFADERRCPIQVDDLAAALLELAAAEDRGLLHVAGADTVDRHAFATLIVRAAGLDPMALVAGPAPPDRPHNCALDVTRARARLATALRGVGEVLGGPSRTAAGRRT